MAFPQVSMIFKCTLICATKVVSNAPALRIRIVQSVRRVIRRSMELAPVQTSNTSKIFSAIRGADQAIQSIVSTRALRVINFVYQPHTKKISQLHDSMRACTTSRKREGGKPIPLLIRSPSPPHALTYALHALSFFIFNKKKIVCNDIMFQNKCIQSCPKFSYEINRTCNHTPITADDLCIKLLSSRCSLQEIDFRIFIEAVLKPCITPIQLILHFFLADK